MFSSIREAGRRRQAHICGGGKKQPRSTVNKGSHSGALLGPAGGLFLSHSQQPGREDPESATMLACTWVRMHTHTYTHTPRLTPGSRQARLGLAEQEKEVARDHTLGGGGSHLRMILSRKSAQKHMDTSTGNEHTGHSIVTGTKPTQAISEGEFFNALFLPLFTLIWANKEAGCDADVMNISYTQVCRSRSFFQNPAGIYWHFKMARGHLAVQEQYRIIMIKEDSIWSKKIS